MMKFKITFKLVSFIIFIVVTIDTSCKAQQTEISYHIIDLTLSENKPFYERESNLIDEIVNGVKHRFLFPYSDFELQEEIPPKEFASIMDKVGAITITKLQIKKEIKTDVKGNILNKIYTSETFQNDYKYESPPIIVAVALLDKNGVIVAIFPYTDLAANLFIGNPHCTFNIQKGLNFFDAFEQNLYYSTVLEK
ncbi:hypothetical protein AAG747_18870 [Rapidithrix thailandica]|uniref:DUF302 domain-containing protein n=1 Tax=Rapidithrix thailandica TaxID=413964 RepID=A0AAW9SH18_9BACT